MRQHPHPHVVYKKIQFLAENPYHPSLNGHQLNQVRGRNIWDAYISNSERILYELKDGILRLWDLGSHSIVDKAHLHKYSEHKLMQHLNFTQKIPNVVSIPFVTEKSEEGDNKSVSESLLFSPPTDLSELYVNVEESQVQDEEVQDKFQYKPINHFKFFEDAHLRILGVPANLIQHVKDAPSTDDALLGLADTNPLSMIK